MPDHRLVFTDQLIARAHAEPEARRRLIYRWAIFDGPGRAEARAQLEAAARLVPEGKRRRALGPLFADDDKQVFAAVGVLLLAKVLDGQGWRVEHEPDVDGVTPDLKIRKGDASFLVEARHVSGDFGVPPAYQRVRAALADVHTRTPASFSVLNVDGGAGLKRFKAFFLRALAEQRPGSLTFQEPGVLICFEFHLPPLDSELPAFFAYGAKEAMWFDDKPAVGAALDEKLKTYPFPLIVALQGIETGNLFKAAEEVLFGTEVLHVPINQATGGPAGPVTRARQPDALVARLESDGERARARLEALLPFEVAVTNRGFAVQARVLANPKKPGVLGLEEFRPIPSLLHMNAEFMSYVGADGTPLKDRDRLADVFYP